MVSKEKKKKHLLYVCIVTLWMAQLADLHTWYCFILPTATGRNKTMNTVNLKGVVVSIVKIYTIQRS